MLENIAEKCAMSVANRTFCQGKRARRFSEKQARFVEPLQPQFSSRADLAVANLIVFNFCVLEP